MQRDRIRVIAGSGGLDERSKRAWLEVASGFEHALTHVHAADDDHARLTRCYRHALKMCDQPPLRTVSPTSPS